jgi:hypothetical protein
VNAARHILCLAWATVPVAAGAQALRDPMQPPQAAGRSAIMPGPSTPQVTAILQGAGGLVAVFNGEPVRGGERVGDCLILAVLANGVRYRRNDRVQEVRLADTRPSYSQPAAPLPSPSRGVDP